MKVRSMSTKKHQILKTALELLVKQGVQATSMAQISSVSGVATGTIYHYFSSKVEIINVLYLEIKKDFDDILLVKDNDLDYKGHLFAFANKLYLFYLKNELKFRFIENIGSLPIISEKTKKEGAKHYQPTMDFLQFGVTNGILKNLPIELLSAFVYVNIVALVNLSLNNPDLIPEGILNDAFYVTWDGIKKK